MYLSESTLVRSPENPDGVQIQNLKVNDFVYGLDDKKIRVKSIEEFPNEEYVTLISREFSTRNKEFSLSISPNQDLHIVVKNARPYITPATDNGRKLITFCFVCNCIESDSSENLDAMEDLLKRHFNSNKRFLKTLKDKLYKKKLNKDGSCHCGGVKADKIRIPYEYITKFKRFYIENNELARKMFNVAEDGVLMKVNPRKLQTFCLLESNFKYQKHLSFKRYSSRSIIDYVTDPSITSIDGYLIGFHYGDGFDKDGYIGVVDADFEFIKPYAEKYVEMLNSHPDYPQEQTKMEVKTHKHKTHTPGLKGFTIMSLSNKNGYSFYRELLKNHGVLQKKINGIPTVFQKSSLEYRLKIIAGAIDSDGFYNNLGKTYEIYQSGDNLNILKDLRNIAMSCGISVSNIKDGEFSDVYLRLALNQTRYRFILYDCIEKLFPYIILPRKKDMDFINSTYLTQTVLMSETLERPKKLQKRAFDTQGIKFMDRVPKRGSMIKLIVDDIDGDQTAEGIFQLQNGALVYDSRD